MIFLTRLLDNQAPGGVVNGDRRVDRRIRTLDRLVRVSTVRDTGLCRLMNISEQGMMLCTGLSLSLRDATWVAFSDTIILSGKVIWTHGEECGLQFDERVNCLLLLRQLAEDEAVGWSRPLRLPLDSRAVLTAASVVEAVRVLDVSQHGMKVAHPLLILEEGSIVNIRLVAGLERRGIVRWSQGGVAGVRLLKPISQAELVSAHRLGHEG